jgi:CubicO group peptidase (beta-lactamase class C family)
VIEQASGASVVLPRSEPAALGLDPARLEKLYQTIERHVADGRYPGAQIAIARHGRLGAFRTFGEARLGQPAADDTLWLLFSQTKMITAGALWQLVDDGAISFADRVADHIPEFERNGKGEITVFQLLTHQGGFPNAQVTPESYLDHARLREEACNFTLEWTPGSRIVYHGLSAHLVAALLIEELTGQDYREAIRQRLLDPLGLSDLYVGVPEAVQPRTADMLHVEDGRFVVSERVNSPHWKAAGVPGGGGYATAAALAAYYQMLLAGGTLNGVRVLSPRVIQFATRNHSGDRPDHNTGIVQGRGMTPATHGESWMPRSMGAIAPVGTFGHGGAGSSFTWADPTAGLTFTYLSNARLDDPWHTRRCDQVSTLVHAALVEP